MNNLRALARKLADETHQLCTQSITGDLVRIGISLESVRRRLHELDTCVQEKWSRSDWATSSAGMPSGADHEPHEAALQRIVHSSLIGTIVWTPNGQVLDANDAFLSMVGYERAELAAGAVRWDAMTPPEFRKADELALAEVAERGQCRPFEKAYLRKDGSLVPVLLSATNLDPAGQLRLAFALDLSQIRAAENAINNLTSIFEGSEDAIITVCIDDKVISWNPAAERLYGYTAEEAMGRSIELIIPDDQLPKYRKFQAVALAGERVSSFETERIHKSGRRVHVALTISPVRNQAGEVVRTIRIAHDITARLQLESELRQAQKMEAIGKLSGGIAHDFNNLLTIIAMHTEMALEAVQEDPQLSDYIQEIKNAGERAASLTRQLLAFSRRQFLSPKNLSLNEVITGMEQMLRRLIGEDILLSKVLNATRDGVNVDPSQLGQIIMNLFVNARDAMPRGGELTIETRNVELDSSYTELHAEIEPGPYVLLAFTDTGCGMDTQTRMQVFEPFFTTKPLGHGTGLGLSTVYGIVKQSGGYISVYSEPGYGATFKIYFPCASVGADISQELEPPLTHARVSETILLVEDEPMVRKVGADVLTQAGYQVLQASNGVEAVAIAKEHAGLIHLMLTDVVMPVMSGSELADLLSPQRPEMSVLFMSGYTDNTINRHGVQDCETNFLQKPFSPRGLLAKVRSVLDCSVEGGGVEGRGVKEHC